MRFFTLQSTTLLSQESAHLHLRRTLPSGPQRKLYQMAACVDAMQDLALDAVDANASANTDKAVVPEQPGTPDATQTASEPAGTADKAKKQRRRRGKKPAAATDKVADENDENAAPADGMPSAAPVDVAAILKARAAAKKGGRKQSDAQKAALANAKARPAQKKSGPKGRRAEGGPREKKTGKSQNDKCLP